MISMQQIEFQVGAKAARLIGRENIADVDGALIELIKNSYDADATCVYVNFHIPFPDVPVESAPGYFSKYLSEKELDFVLQCYEEKKPESKKQAVLKKKADLSDEIQNKLRQLLFAHNRIIVADNGCGMTMDIVKSAWMYIGTSNKEYQVKSDKGRTKTGAKGIGRFALDKLSIKSAMYTKARSEKKGIRWNMDWDQFANVRLISDVKAEMDLCSSRYKDIIKKIVGKDECLLKEHNWSTGTVIVLTPTREAWSDRLFQKVNTNLKSINPIGSADQFQVIVKNSFYPKFDYKTDKVAIDPEDYDYRIMAEYDGKSDLKIDLLRNEVDLSKKYITVEKYGKVEKRSLDEFWSREKLQEEGRQRNDYKKEIRIIKNVEEVLPADGLDRIQKVGPFTAEMYFLRNNNNEYEIMKNVSARKRKKLLTQFSGVKLYRDEFKVRPYGDEGAMYDWLGLSSRVQRSPASVAHPNGAWRVQPYQLIGLIKIGRESNPNLEDMANREGIALTDTYYIFVNLIQECLKEFEYDRQYIYREYAKWIQSIEDAMTDYVKSIQEEATRRVEHPEREAETIVQENTEVSEKEVLEEKRYIEKDARFTEKEMYDTVYKMMKESEKDLNSKQMIQILSSSGILLNTFFHEFQAINTQFHVQASQIRSRVNYILKGKEYQGLPAYNPYHRIDNLEKNDMLTAAFLDVIMDGLSKESLKIRETPLKKLMERVLSKWSVLLEEKHIFLNLQIIEEESIQDRMPIALVDMYIILNNFILNSAWFLEQEHNLKREISFILKECGDDLHLIMENNGPALAKKYELRPDKIFEMGETSKEGKGTGLGLWVVKETVERYDGLIFVMNRQHGFGLEIIWKRKKTKK